MNLRKLLKGIAHKIGYSIIRNDSLKAINQRLAEAEESRFASQILALLEIMQVSDIKRFLKYGKLSNAQLLQDLFVLESCDFKRNGFFVEFGATDGIRHSNTYLLEKAFGWNGILAEPATTWHRQLLSNRSAKIDTRCVWRESNLTLEFSEDSSAELSSLTQYKDQGMHSGRRVESRNYKVETVSLEELLVIHGAPKVIDYLSIDTEGSELSILEAFNWAKFDFLIITVEHNYSETRESILNLLQSSGYKRVYPEFSKFDDWYIHRDLKQ